MINFDICGHTDYFEAIRVTSQSKKDEKNILHIF